MVLGMRGIRDISPLWLNRVVHMVMEREKEKGGEHRDCCSAKSVPFPLLLHPDPLVMVPSTLMGSPSPQLILLKVLLHLLGDSKSGQLDHED